MSMEEWDWQRQPDTHEVFTLASRRQQSAPSHQDAPFLGLASTQRERDLANGGGNG